MYSADNRHECQASRAVRGNSGTFHDLQKRLSRSCKVSRPEEGMVLWTFADGSTLEVDVDHGTYAVRCLGGF